MTRRVLLHIGMHRTGSTSLQEFLGDHRESLVRAAGWTFPVGMFMPNNHIELQIASIRDERARPTRYDQRHDPGFRDRVAQQIRRERGSQLVYSTELLSYLRYDDEVERLLALFGGAEVEALVVHREASAYLESYAWAIRLLGGELSNDPDSMHYVGPDSWLADHESRARLWRHHLGDDRFHVVDYERCLHADGSVIPAVTDRLGIPRAALPDLRGYRRNTRPPPTSSLAE